MNTDYIVLLYRCFILVTLAQWKVENESLFYVFVRPRVQPVWCEEFSSEAVLDPKEGYNLNCNNLNTLVFATTLLRINNYYDTIFYL